MIITKINIALFETYFFFYMYSNYSFFCQNKKIIEFRLKWINVNQPKYGDQKHI